jgi:hypothetical protein
LETAGQEAQWLGLEGTEPKSMFIAVFVPSRTRDGEPVDHGYWRDEAVRTMSKLFGGATALTGSGGWLDEERGARIKQETVSVVFSFFRAADWNEHNVLQLRRFLQRMGREAEQGEIGLYSKGRYWPMRRFDNE